MSGCEPIGEVRLALSYTSPILLCRPSESQDIPGMLQNSNYRSGSHEGSQKTPVSPLSPVEEALSPLGQTGMPGLGVLTQVGPRVSGCY